MKTSVTPVRQNILGAPVDAVDLAGALALVRAWVREGRGTRDERRGGSWGFGVPGEPLPPSPSPRGGGGDGDGGHSADSADERSRWTPPPPLGEGEGRRGSPGTPNPHEPPRSPLRHVVTVNPEFVVAARRDPVFAQALREAALATADGVGIVLAGRVLRVPLGPRVTGVELTEGLAALADPALRLFLLGAAPGVAADAAAALARRYPGVVIAGTFAGDPDDASLPEIERRLAAAHATVLLVAFGHPRQDLWIARHRERLAAHGILVAIGVGGTFDYLSGRVPRAPRLLRRLGLEWLYRLIRQPWRWRRQLALPLFVLLVLRERMRRGATRDEGRGTRMAR